MRRSRRASRGGPAQRALEAPRPILDASAREGMLAALETARDGEMRARLDVETLRERIRAGEARVVQLERQREREREAAAEAARRTVIRRAQREVAAAVAAQLPAVLDSVDRSVSQARVELAAAESARTAVTRRARRTPRQEIGPARATRRAHRERAQPRAADPREAAPRRRAWWSGRPRSSASTKTFSFRNMGRISRFPSRRRDDEGAERHPFPSTAPQQRRRLQDAERKLAQLGRVNPLALEEFAALEQRHKFLTEQLADLTQTRKDLITIIEELDERMQAIFLAAFEDTRAAFDEVFPVLFPGGAGSISLTNPDEPLTTGIEVAVRPAGKKIERLSLLSGGERSLAAVALLVAIFKARPEPVLHPRRGRGSARRCQPGRLLGVFEQLRESSQLIVITHQKRTMEIADALYGVSMRQDGVSAVVGQRVGERASA